MRSFVVLFGAIFNKLLNKQLGCYLLRRSCSVIVISLPGRTRCRQWRRVCPSWRRACGSWTPLNVGALCPRPGDVTTADDFRSRASSTGPPPTENGGIISWWRHQMKAFSALQALCEGNSLVTGEFPSQRPVTWSFDIFFDLRLNNRLSKPSRRRWFEAPSRSLWSHPTAK